MASGLNKPNGMTVILPEDAQAFVESLPIEKFHGIGKVTATIFSFSIIRQIYQ